MAPRTATPEPLAYLLRDIDPALWQRFKTRAERDGLSLRALLLQMVGAYTDGAVAIEQRIVSFPSAARRVKGGRI